MSTIERAIDKLHKAPGPGEGQPDVSGAALGATEVHRTQDATPARAAAGRPQSEISSPASEGRVHHIDFALLSQRGFLTPDQAQTRIAEEYRIIKRPVLANAFGAGAAPLRHGNLIMVTSALSGEGKTFTSMNLALSMASELDNTVLLIDADVVKASLTRLIGLQGRPGLIDLLLDERLDVGDVMVGTNVAKLRVIPAGRTHGHSTELLASEQMRRLADGLATRYADRLVLFDAPPLLVTTQAHVLSDLMGQILLVVEAGETPQKLVQEAVLQLDRQKAIGLILNKSSGRLGTDYYGGYYGSYGKT